MELKIEQIVNWFELYKLTIKSLITHLNEFPCHSGNKFVVSGQQIKCNLNSNSLKCEIEVHLKGKAITPKVSAMRYFSKVLDGICLIRIYIIYSQPVFQKGTLKNGTTCKTKTTRTETYR